MNGPYEVPKKSVVMAGRSHKIMIQPKRFSMKVIFGAKSAAKTVGTTFTPLPRIIEKKINELQAMIFDEESASDAQKFLAPPKRGILEKKNDAKFFFKVPICFRRRKMKCRESSETRFPKVSRRSEPSRGVNGRLKILCPNKPSPQKRKWS